MSMFVDVTLYGPGLDCMIESGNKKGRQYQFIFLEYHGDFTLFLERVFELSRASYRHKWRAEESYYRLRRKSDEDEPVVPGEIVREALERLRARIVFKRWEDR